MTSLLSLDLHAASSGSVAVMTRLNLTWSAAAVALAVITVALAACDSGRPGGIRKPSSTAAKTAVPFGSSEQSIVVDGRRRTYRIFRPKTAANPAALVVMLHGALGTGAQAESSYGWDDEAESAGFVVVYPDGYKRSWNVSGECCGPPAAAHVNDVAFITALVRHVSTQLPIDPDRVYATGISNGGMLAYRLACDTTIFAAIGPDSATELNACPSPAPISVIHVHGRADQTVPYDGGPGRRDNGGTGDRPADTDGPPIPALIDTWRHVDHCAAPRTDTSGAITTSTAICPDHRAVVLVAIAGAGHQWPGGAAPSGVMAGLLDPPYPGFEATDAIWHFFAGHPKRG